MNRSRTVFSRLVIAVAALGLFTGISAAFAQARPPARRFEFRYLVRVPQPPAGTKTLRLWIPLPQSNENQTISELKIETALAYSRYRDPEYGNEYLYLEASPAKIQHPLEILVRFQVERRELHVVLDSAADPPSAAVAKAELARFLQPDRLVPINGIIAQLSQDQTRGVTDPLEKARKIYEYVTATMRYDKSGTGWGRGDAVWACDSHHGNCTDFHSLFIGMARAAGIPARFEIGFPLPDDQHEGAIPGYHCWAQFYIQGIGWIPVDASEAWKHPDRHNYYFGALDPGRVLFTSGRDIRLDPPQQGELLNYFIYPYAETDGRPFAEVKGSFSFRDLPAGAAAVSARR